MSPSDLETILHREPKVPLRFTLASGDQIVVDNPAKTLIAQYELIFTLPSPDAPHGYVKFISIPNITMVERLDPRRPQNGHSRRRRK
jgi:hypothetical protein